MNSTKSTPIPLTLISPLIVFATSGHGDDPLNDPIPPGAIISPNDPNIDAI